MGRSSVVKLEKMIAHKFVPITMSNTNVSNEPLHFIRSSIRPIIVDPSILDKIPVYDKSEWPNRLEEFFTLATSNERRWISNKERAIFESYMKTRDTNKVTAADHSVSIEKLGTTISKVKRLLYIYFSEEFGIKVVPEKWVTAYVPLCIPDETETFIPGNGNRS